MTLGIAACPGHQAFLAYMLDAQGATACIRSTASSCGDFLGSLFKPARVLVIAQWAQCLPGIHKALGSIPNPALARYSGTPIIPARKDGGNKIRSLRLSLAISNLRLAWTTVRLCLKEQNKENNMERLPDLASVNRKCPVIFKFQMHNKRLFSIKKVTQRPFFFT